MAIGSSVNEVPDSEEEPLTSSPDPRAVAGPTEEQPQHASPGTDGALDEDCDIQKCNSNSSETFAPTDTQPRIFEQSPNTPTPACRYTSLPADRYPPSNLSVDHVSASDLTPPLVKNKQRQSSTTGEQAELEISQRTGTASQSDHVNASTPTNPRSRSDPVTAADEAAQMPTALEPGVAPPPSQIQSPSPREPQPPTQLSSFESTNNERSNTPTKNPQETILAELKAQKAALIASLASLPSIQALVAEAKNANPAVQETGTEYTDNDIMDAARRINQKHIKLLHEYNEIKDVGQGLMGLIADQRGVRIIEVQDEFGIESKD